MGVGLAGTLNRDPFVQDLEVSAITTSLVTVTLFLPMLATGIVHNVNKPGQSMISFSSYPSISLPRSPGSCCLPKPWAIVSEREIRIKK